MTGGSWWRVINIAFLGVVLVPVAAFAMPSDAIVGISNPANERQVAALAKRFVRTERFSTIKGAPVLPRKSGAVPHIESVHIIHVTVHGEKQLSTSDLRNPFVWSPPPLGRRFLIAFFLVIGGFGAAVLGAYYMHKKRRALGASLIGIGCFSGPLGFGLWFITGFEWTWGWIV